MSTWPHRAAGNSRLAGHSGPERGQHPRRGIGRPLADRGERPRRGQHRRHRGQQQRRQRVPHPRGSRGSGTSARCFRRLGYWAASSTRSPAGRSLICPRAGLISDDETAGTAFREDHWIRHPHDLGSRACPALKTPERASGHQPGHTPLCRGPALYAGPQMSSTSASIIRREPLDHLPSKIRGRGMTGSHRTAHRDPAQCHLWPLRSPSSRSEHFEGSRGGRLTSQRHARHGRNGHNSAGTSCTTQ